MRYILYELVQSGSNGWRKKMEISNICGRRFLPVLFVVCLAMSLLLVWSVYHERTYGSDTITYYSPLKTGAATDTVNVRTGPGTNYSKVATYPKGSTFAVYSLVVRNGSSWYKTTYDGKWAYITTDYVSVPKNIKPVETYYDPY